MRVIDGEVAASPGHTGWILKASRGLVSTGRCGRRLSTSASTGARYIAPRGGRYVEWWPREMEREIGRRRQLSNEIAKRRLRERWRRTLEEAFRPRQGRRRPPVGICARCDPDGATLRTPTDIFESLQEFESAELGRDRKAEDHIAHMRGGEMARLGGGGKGEWPWMSTSRMS